MQNSKVKIGYWGFKGKGEIVKMVATYLNVPFEEVTYMDKDKWFKEDKVKLGLPFPNLPYLIDGDAKFTETYAICTYLCMKANKKELLGTTPVEQAQVRAIQEILADAFIDLFKELEPKDGAKGRVAKLGKEGAVYVKFSQLSKYLGTKDYYLGKKVSIADICSAGYLYMLDLMIRSAGGDSLLQKFSNLGKMIGAIMSTPSMKARNEDPNNQQRPIFPPGMLPFDIIQDGKPQAEQTGKNSNGAKEGKCCILI